MVTETEERYYDARRVSELNETSLSPVVYPLQHRALFEEVGSRGLLLTEYPLGSRPEGFRFPERNRIISGISLGVVVVEASPKSGSLITAGLALEQGREVFAVPGRIDSVKSQGTHRLLQQGAKLVHSVDDILEELNLAGMFAELAPDDLQGLQPVPMTAAEQQLWHCLDVYPLTVRINWCGRPALIRRRSCLCCWSWS